MQDFDLFLLALMRLKTSLRTTKDLTIILLHFKDEYLLFYFWFSYFQISNMHQIISSIISVRYATIRKVDRSLFAGEETRYYEENFWVMCEPGFRKYASIPGVALFLFDMRRLPLRENNTFHDYPNVKKIVSYAMVT